MSDTDPQRSAPPLQGNCLVCAVGKLTPESPLKGRLDFGDGQVLVGSDQKELAEAIGAVAAGSVVAVSGTLRRHQWSIGSGQLRESLELVAQRLIVLYDARLGRLLA